MTWHRSSAALIFLLILNFDPVMSFSIMLNSATFIDKLALILVKNRRQLVVRSKGKEAFFTPGGKREAGESDEDALCRECKEELAVDLRKGSIRPYGVFQAQAFGKPEGTMVRMTCFTADYEGTLQPSAEIEELKWVDSGFEHKYLTVTGIQIIEDLKAKGLIE
mmetsp:Transcript_229/g.290  ORF Transcript_229/g.290 Transcript_229/m.290 type:complete len:164 (-) Transcript_229:257-748(-)